MFNHSNNFIDFHNILSPKMDLYFYDANNFRARDITKQANCTNGED